MHGLAQTPVPACSAGTSTSRRTGSDPDRYDDASGRVLDVAQLQPGFAGVGPARRAGGPGITVYHGLDGSSSKCWRDHDGRRATREPGRAYGYEVFLMRIAPVERAYAPGADE